MYTKVLLTISFVLLFTGCSTLRVSVDYDETYNFNDAKNVVVVHEHKESENTLINDRIINALNNTLESKKYVKTSQKEADLVFVFYTDVKDKTQVNTEYISMGRRYRFGSMMTSTSTYEYTEGSIVIDALHPKTKKIVWRGVGTKELNENYTPKEKTECINKLIHKIMEKFPTK